LSTRKFFLSDPTSAVPEKLRLRGADLPRIRGPGHGCHRPALNAPQSAKRGPTRACGAGRELRGIQCRNRPGKKGVKPVKVVCRHGPGGFATVGIPPGSQLSPPFFRVSQGNETRGHKGRKTLKWFIGTLKDYRS
jgi:hypothetical protein